MHWNKEGGAWGAAMSLPAIFPARRPPVLFKAILILGCITLGLIPSGILALLPVDERLFLKQPYFLVFFAGVGLSASFITFLVRIPVRYIITNDCLHIVSEPSPADPSNEINGKTKNANAPVTWFISRENTCPGWNQASRHDQMPATPVDAHITLAAGVYRALAVVVVSRIRGLSADLHHRHGRH